MSHSLAIMSVQKLLLKPRVLNHNWSDILRDPPITSLALLAAYVSLYSLISSCLICHCSDATLRAPLFYLWHALLHRYCFFVLMMEMLVATFGILRKRAVLYDLRRSITIRLLRPLGYLIKKTKANCFCVT
jgi:hypothetical protein